MAMFPTLNDFIKIILWIDDGLYLRYDRTSLIVVGRLLDGRIRTSFGLSFEVVSRFVKQQNIA